MLSILIIFCLLNWSCKACIVNGEDQCDGSDLTCPLSENCFVNCTAQSCIKKTIMCPINGDCSIECVGFESCKNSVVINSGGNLNILCTGNRSECSGIKIYANVNYGNNNGAFNMTCSGNYSSCIDSEIYCPTDGNCTIWCNGDASCQRSMIMSPRKHVLTINCNSKQSCFGAVFDGLQASKLNITGCKEPKSCFDLAIYCPPNHHGQKNCYIEGNDNLGKDKGTKSPTSSTLAPTPSPTYAPTFKPTSKQSISPTPDPGQGIKIHAINGWHDIAITYNGTFGDGHGGIMLCGENFDISCDIAKHEWSCGSNTIMNCNAYDNSTRNNLTEKPINIATTLQPVIKPPMINPDNVRADIFILIGVGLVIITCLCVGCAQIRKNMHDLKDPSIKASPHYELSRSHRSRSRSHYSQRMDRSRSYRSHRGSKGSRGSRTSRSHSVYDHPIQLSS